MFSQGYFICNIELKKDMNKYEHIFDDAPIGIWEEDWTGIKSILDPLKNKFSKEEFADYLMENDHIVKELAKSIKVVRVNKKVTEMYKVEDEQSIKLLDDTFCEKSYDSFRDEMISLFNEEDYFESETVTKDSEGNDLHTIIKIKLPKKDIDFENVVVVMLDVTDTYVIKQKYNEIKLKFNKSFYDSLVGMAIVDCHGIIIDVNKEFCNFIQYNKKELIGKGLFELEYDKDSSIFKNMGKDSQFDKIGAERLLLRKDGKSVWAYIGLSLLKDDNDNPLYILGQILNIDEQKKNILKIESNLKKYKQMIESTEISYLILNSEGEIVECNNNFCELLPCGDNNIFKKPLRALVSTESIPVFDKSWKDLKSGETINSVEISLSKNGVFKWVSLNASMIQNGGEKVFMLMSDISRKKNEEIKGIIDKAKKRDKLIHNIRDIKQSLKRINVNDFSN